MMLLAAGAASTTTFDWQFWCTTALAALAALYLLRSILRVLVPRPGGRGVATPCAGCPEMKGSANSEGSSNAARVPLTISARSPES